MCKIGTCHLKQEDCAEEDATTTITDLPDAILVHILSFLPTEDAVKTALVRRFGDLWRAVPVLEFINNSKGNNSGDHVNDGVLRRITHVLNLHDCGTLHKLRIGLVFPEYGRCHAREQIVVPYPQRTIECVKNSIAYAMRRKVEILDLDFNIRCFKINHRHKLYDLSDHRVLVSDHLTDLRLAACGIPSLSCGGVSLKSLRVLFLEVVSLTDATMDRILDGCPLLEDLSLVDCHTLERLTCRNPKLTRLAIIRGAYFCTIRVECPHVLRLEIIGAVEGVALLDASSVVDVAIHVGGGVNVMSIGHVGLDRRFWGLMQKVSHCKVLRAGAWTVEELAMCAHRFCDWPSFCHKSLVMEISLRMENQPGIALLLRNSQSLETLTLHFHPKKDLKLPFGVREWESLDSYLKAATFPSLETINIHGYISSPYVYQLVQVLLRCAVRLKKLLISTKDANCPFGQKGYPYNLNQQSKLSLAYGTLRPSSTEAIISLKL